MFIVEMEFKAKELMNKGQIPYYCLHDAQKTFDRFSKSDAIRMCRILVDKGTSIDVISYYTAVNNKEI